MKINYCNNNMSLKPLWGFVVFSVISFSLMFYYYCEILHSYHMEFTLNNLYSYISACLSGKIYYAHHLYVEILFLIMFIYLFIVIITTLISSYLKYNSGLNLKSVDLKQTCVCFSFNKFYSDFYVKYEDIEQVRLIINSSSNNYRFPEFITIKDVDILFTLKNGKQYKITNYPFIMNLFLFEFLSYSKKFSDFNYSFNGEKEPLDTRKIIESYLNTNSKTFLSKSSYLLLYATSIVLFIFGILFFIMLNILVQEGMYIEQIGIIVASSIIFIFSFILDVILFIDSIIEKKNICYKNYGNYNKNISLINRTGGFTKNFKFNIVFIVKSLILALSCIVFYN